MKKGIISYGEAFVDYIAQDLSNSHYKTFLGGTTLNVAVGARRLGTPVYYLCKLGTDDISQFIKTELRNEQVNQEFCIETDLKRICGVYVHLNKKGERYFHSYVNETPDEQLLDSEINEELFKRSFIFYCGSGTLFHSIAYKTTKAAIQLAKKHGTLIAFDPNIRMKRWDSEQLCRSTIKSILSGVNILKLSEEELLFLMETSTVEEGIQKLAHYNVPYIWVTLGEKGAIVVHQDKVIHVQGKKVQVIDTTGAGDAFMAGILHCIHTNGLPMNENELTTYTMYGNNLGSIAATKQGALTALTDPKDQQA
jgi:fructokinase